MACASLGVVQKRGRFYENLINRSGHRHRVSGDVFRFNDRTHLVNPPGQEAPHSYLLKQNTQKRGTDHFIFRNATLLKRVSFRNKRVTCPSSCFVLLPFTPTEKKAAGDFGPARGGVEEIRDRSSANIRAQADRPPQIHRFYSAAIIYGEERISVVDHLGRAGICDQIPIGVQHLAAAL
jgi:hypothetical protein